MSTASSARTRDEKPSSKPVVYPIRRDAEVEVEVREGERRGRDDEAIEAIRKHSSYVVSGNTSDGYRSSGSRSNDRYKYDYNYEYRSRGADGRNGYYDDEPPECDREEVDEDASYELDRRHDADYVGHGDDRGTNKSSGRCTHKPPHSDLRPNPSENRGDRLAVSSETVKDPLPFGVQASDPNPTYKASTTSASSSSRSSKPISSSKPSMLPPGDAGKLTPAQKLKLRMRKALHQQIVSDRKSERTKVEFMLTQKSVVILVGNLILRTIASE